MSRLDCNHVFHIFNNANNRGITSGIIAYWTDFLFADVVATGTVANVPAHGDYGFPKSHSFRLISPQKMQCEPECGLSANAGKF